MSKVAERLSKLFVYDEEIKRTVFAVLQGEDYTQLSNLVHSLDVDEDTAYNEVSSALDAIADAGLEYIQDNIHDYCDPNIYTHDLLEWVSRSTRNVAWCDEALMQRGGENFIDIIMSAQFLAKRYIWQSTVDLVYGIEEE